MRFSSNAQRVANRLELQRELQAVFQLHDAGHWVRLLNDAGVPAQAINNMSAPTPFCVCTLLSALKLLLQGKSVWP